MWIKESRTVKCPCHYSEYDPTNLATVVAGPTPKRLPILPIKTVDGDLLVAAKFIGKVGFKRNF